MSTLHFSHATKKLDIHDKDDKVINSVVAVNNVDSHSNGPWPVGMFHFQVYNPHHGFDADSEYGSHGIFIFDVHGRSGMGVHSGRKNIPDGRGRVGPEHCTMGCIRTTEDAVAELVKLHQTDPLTDLVVV